MCLLYERGTFGTDCFRGTKPKIHQSLSDQGGSKMWNLTWGYVPCVCLSVDGVAFLLLSFLVFQQLRKMHNSLKSSFPAGGQGMGSVAPRAVRSHFINPIGVGRLTSLGTLEYDSHTSTRLNLSGGQTRFSFILLLFASTVGELHSSFTT